MSTTLQHPEGSVELHEMGAGRRRVDVTLADPDQFSPIRSWETAYPRGLIESILTTGLPLLNYLPDRMALRVARRFSRRVDGDESWESLLRAGVRGGTVGEILGILEASDDGAPLLLQPSQRGLEDQVDLWYSYSALGRPARIKRLMRSCFTLMSRVGGTLFAPSLRACCPEGSVGFVRRVDG